MSAIGLNPSKLSKVMSQAQVYILYYIYLFQQGRHRKNILMGKYHILKALERRLKSEQIAF